MPKKNKVATATTSTGDTGMVVVAYGDALALGEDTLTSVSTSIKIKDKGGVTKAKGEIETIAAAESPDGAVFVSAENDVTASGADHVIIKTTSKTFEGNGESYTVSVTKFKAIDIEGKEGPTKVVEHHNAKSIDDEHFGIELNGNVSYAEFDVQASGENSLAIVDVYSLAYADELSITTIVATAATG